MKLTPWFDCVDQPPARTGWYDVQFPDVRGDTRFWFEDGYWRFTPEDWFVAPERIFRGARWRGLLK